MDLKTTLARIDRDMAEARKVTAEQPTSIAEAQKLGAERVRLAEAHTNLTFETLKIDRYRWLSPALAVVAWLLAPLRSLR